MMLRRREIVEALELLSDERYQRDARIGRAPSGTHGFNDVIADLYDTGEVRSALAAPLEESGLSAQEHRLLTDAVAAIDALLEAHPSDESERALLEDPRWPEIRRLAAAAARALRAGGPRFQS